MEDRNVNKKLIVSIYDGGYNISIYNGRLFNRDQIEKLKSSNKLSQLYNLISLYSDYIDFIKNNFKEYDEIIICEDGGINIIK